jgi:hypothetical protein
MASLFQIERTERIHEHVVELRKVHGDRLRSRKPAWTSQRCSDSFRLIACGLLFFFIVVLQVSFSEVSLVHQVMTMLVFSLCFPDRRILYFVGLQFLLRNLARIGALVLNLAELRGKFDRFSRKFPVWMKTNLRTLCNSPDASYSLSCS